MYSSKVFKALSLTRWGFFITYVLAGIANDMTNKQLYDGYHSPANTDALKQSYFDTLKKRASYGYADAKKYVDKIEACKSN